MALSHLSGWAGFSCGASDKPEETFDSETGAALLREWGVPCPGRRKAGS